MKKTLMAAIVVAAASVSAVSLSTGAMAQTSPGSAVPLGAGEPPAGSPGRGGNVGGPGATMAQPMKRMRRHGMARRHSRRARRMAR